MSFTDQLTLWFSFAIITVVYLAAASRILQAPTRYRRGGTPNLAWSAGVRLGVLSLVYLAAAAIVFALFVLAVTH